jgi:hypothetical protein
LSVSVFNGSRIVFGFCLRGVLDDQIVPVLPPNIIGVATGNDIAVIATPDRFPIPGAVMAWLTMGLTLS